MTKIQKLISLAAAFILMIGLSACTVDGSNIEDNEVIEFTITLADGTDVPCIKVSGLYGIDCDWDRAKKS